LLASLLAVWILMMPAYVKDRAIMNVAVSSKGRWLAAGTRYGSVMACASEGHTCKTFNTKAGELNDLRFSPDQRFLAIE